MRKHPEPTKYRPLNPDKYVGNLNEITMRSSWESHLAFWLDRNPSVLKWGSEIQPIHYYSRVDQCLKRYYPDFWVLIKQSDGSEKKFIVEVKPNAQIFQPKSGKNKEKYIEDLKTWIKNQDKWQAAREFAKKHNFEFLVMDEFSLGLKKRK